MSPESRAPVDTDVSSVSRAAPVIPCFYINRDCDLDRHESLSAYLAAADLTAERVTGVEGLDVPPQFRDFFFSGGKLHSKLKPGEVGCYASHLVAMERIVERDLDYALIVEDDAVLPADLVPTLTNILANLPKGWDIVHFCRDSNRAVKIITRLNNNRSLVRFSRVPHTTTGYLISRSGAKKFLKQSKRYWPIDTDFRQPWQFGLEIYGVAPTIIRSAGFPSGIEQMGAHSRLRRGIPIPTHYCWTGNPLHTPVGFLFNVKNLGLVSWAACMVRNARRRFTGEPRITPKIVQQEA